MLLAINVYNVIYTCIFLTLFVIAYFTILATHLEKAFKQGSIWQIRIAQVLLAIIIAYLASQGIMSLVNATQF